MAARDLTCRETVDFLMAYLEGELPPEDRAAFDAHLAECPDCVSFLRAYRTTVTLEKLAFEEPEAPVPAGVPEDLVAAILEMRRRPR